MDKVYDTKDAYLCKIAKIAGFNDMMYKCEIFLEKGSTIYTLCKYNERIGYYKDIRTGATFHESHIHDNRYLNPDDYIVVEKCKARVPNFMTEKQIDDCLNVARSFDSNGEFHKTPSRLEERNFDK